MQGGCIQPRAGLIQSQCSLHATCPPDANKADCTVHQVGWQAHEGSCTMHLGSGQPTYARLGSLLDILDHAAGLALQGGSPVVHCQGVPAAQLAPGIASLDYIPRDQKLFPLSTLIGRSVKTVCQCNRGSLRSPQPHCWVNAPSQYPTLQLAIQRQDKFQCESCCRAATACKLAYAASAAARSWHVHIWPPCPTAHSAEGCPGVLPSLTSQLAHRCLTAAK